MEIQEKVRISFNAAIEKMTNLKVNNPAMHTELMEAAKNIDKSPSKDPKAIKKAEGLMADIFGKLGLDLDQANTAIINVLCINLYLQTQLKESDGN